MKQTPFRETKEEKNGMKTKEEMSYELCSQLHKQYAEADNNKNKSLISFVGALAFAFTLYGYVYENYFIDKKETCLLIATTFLASMMLFAIYSVSLIYGYTQRRDQIIIENIRNEYINNYMNIFGNLYSAQNKKLHNFIPDYYLLVSAITFFLQLGLLLFTHYNICCKFFSFETLFCCGSFLYIDKILMFIYIGLYIYYYYKYDNIRVDNNNILSCEVDEVIIDEKQKSGGQQSINKYHCSITKSKKQIILTINSINQ
ncbi:MAG: hypothetical protein IJP59_12490 [Muribaculaceae bacterium]|nr:hypothetical protein [Muribaculaceae bacterium]